MESWRQSVESYNEEYEKLNRQIKYEYKQAGELLTLHKPNAEIAKAISNVAKQLARLVELRSEGGWNYRGLKDFYERTVIERKHEILRTREEKNLTEAAAYEEAILASSEEFELLNLAQAYYDNVDGRFIATKLLIESLQLRLTYGENP